MPVMPSSSHGKSLPEALRYYMLTPNKVTLHKVLVIAGTIGAIIFLFVLIVGFFSLFFGLKVALGSTIVGVSIFVIPIVLRAIYDVISSWGRTFVTVIHNVLPWLRLDLILPARLDVIRFMSTHPTKEEIYSFVRLHRDERWYLRFVFDTGLPECKEAVNRSSECDEIERQRRARRHKEIEYESFCKEWRYQWRYHSDWGKYSDLDPSDYIKCERCGCPVVMLDDSEFCKDTYCNMCGHRKSYEAGGMA